MDYTVGDLFSLIGDIRIEYILIFLGVLIGAIIGYCLGKKIVLTIRKFYKDLNEYRDLKETINVKEKPISTLKEEIDQVVINDRANDKISKELEDEPTKAEETKIDSLGRPYSTRRKLASTDRKDYPEVFNAMYKLNKDLIAMIGHKELARRAGVSATVISTINGKQITTVKTAKKYIKKFNAILNDMLENETIDQTLEQQELPEEHKKALDKLENNSKEAELQKELNRLIDYLLDNMTQSELATRVGIPQPYISEISRRVPVRNGLMETYITKLQNVERSILGTSLGNRF